MPLDDLVLRLQRLLDRLVRRCRLGPAPPATARRLLIVQIDGLSRAVLEQGLEDGAAPFLARLLRQRGWRFTRMSVGLPTSTPAFQLSVMYGVRPDIPGFHYHDKRHRRARRALRRIDRSIHQLWRVLRRVPEHRYDLYVLSDHGQAACTPYVRLSGGKPIEQALFDDFLDPLAVHAERAAAGRARRVVDGIAAYRTHRAPGLFQRFVHYLERDFPRVLGGTRGVREHNGIRVVSAGPNA